MPGIQLLSKFIEQRIFIIRGKKVMIDRDLAELYQVTTKRLNEQVRRNKDRFPRDFMFRLQKKEVDELVAICDHLKPLKFSYQLPYVFTEQGVAMLSSVLNSQRAIQVNIQIMRTFTKLREMMISHKALAAQFNAIEKKFKEVDQNFVVVFDAIRKILEEPKPRKTKIGFHVD